MKRDEVILLFTAIILAETTLIAFLGYRYYQKLAPTISNVETVGGGLTGLLDFITGKPTNTGTGG